MQQLGDELNQLVEELNGYENRRDLLEDRMNLQWAAHIELQGHVSDTVWAFNYGSVITILGVDDICVKTSELMRRRAEVRFFWNELRIEALNTEDSLKHFLKAITKKKAVSSLFNSL
ncbi:hypothetical protein RHGRI_021103 [Rhododendron griersonianum]|uniref:Uncharacterized protein n=1 Tax=Rhododendron griersonianum TaxID=479676 RepID=A0AAV6JP71_9ERIC|nr:hypothetical protein RHGRI_021103 [Rhododendron griersonianum]